MDEKKWEINVNIWQKKKRIPDIQKQRKELAKMKWFLRRIKKPLEF